MGVYEKARGCVYERARQDVQLRRKKRLDNTMTLAEFEVGVRLVVSELIAMRHRLKDLESGDEPDPVLHGEYLGVYRKWTVGLDAGSLMNAVQERYSWAAREYVKGVYKGNIEKENYLPRRILEAYGWKVWPPTEEGGKYMLTWNLPKKAQSPEFKSLVFDLR